jgi:hypothetical protein
MITKRWDIFISHTFLLEAKRICIKPYGKTANFTLGYLSPTPEQVQEAYDSGKLDRDMAMIYLRELVEKQVDWSLGAGPEDIVRLIIREHTNPTQNGDIIYEVLFKCVIKAFALLIMTISGINDLNWAII